MPLPQFRSVPTRFSMEIRSLCQAVPIQFKAEGPSHYSTRPTKITGTSSLKSREELIISTGNLLLREHTISVPFGALLGAAVPTAPQVKSRPYRSPKVLPLSSCLSHKIAYSL